jgi:hypothetical protein
MELGCCEAERETELPMGEGVIWNIMEEQQKKTCCDWSGRRHLGGPRDLGDPLQSGICHGGTPRAWWASGFQKRELDRGRRMTQGESEAARGWRRDAITDAAGPDVGCPKRASFAALVHCIDHQHFLLGYPSYRYQFSFFESHLLLTSVVSCDRCDSRQWRAKNFFSSLALRFSKPLMESVGP